MSNYTGFLPNTIYDNIVEIPLASLPPMTPVGGEMTYLGMKCVILGRAGENLQLAVEQPAYKASRPENMVPLTVTNGAMQSNGFSGTRKWVDFDATALQNMFSEVLNDGETPSFTDTVKVKAPVTTDGSALTVDSLLQMNEQIKASAGVPDTLLISPTAAEFMGLKVLTSSFLDKDTVLLVDEAAKIKAKYQLPGFSIYEEFAPTFIDEMDTETINNRIKKAAEEGFAVRLLDVELPIAAREI